MKRDVRHRFGDKVRAVRKAAGLTQDQLADAAGLDRGHISNIECGRYFVMLDTIALLAKALKVKIPDLMPDR